MDIHVAQLGPVPPPEGGVARNLWSIRERVIAAGGRCTVIATTRSTTKISDSDIKYPGSPIELIRELRGLAADIVHLHIGGEVTFRVLMLALAVSKLGRGKSVVTVHSGGFPASKAAGRGSLGRLTAKVLGSFDRVIAVNRPIEAALKRVGIDDDKILYVLPFELKTPDPKVEFPQEISEFIEGAEPLIVSVGGLESVYDPIFQIGSMQEIVGKFPQARLIIVGDGPLRDECSMAAAESGSGKSILLAGNIGHDLTLKLIGTADVMLRTTHFDGDSIAIREAMFLGTPVVATDNGMRPDGVITIADFDPKSLAEAVSLSISRPRPVGGDTGQASPIDDILGVYKRLAIPGR
ncbi:MAG: glycosyltransferase [Acidobacteria bacterium]|nr:glycosyltransferase [Acidobacteriota bacterium]MCW5948170.1 glycosyltransferase [Pyrinomonadaceae bacterium]